MNGNYDPAESDYEYELWISRFEKATREEKDMMLLVESKKQVLSYLQEHSLTRDEINELWEIHNRHI